MVKKLHTAAEDGDASSPLASTVKESAQQIWLAGLGALSKAQEEGDKVFDALVKEGVSIQKRTQAVAEEKLGEASNRMAGVATELSSKASGQWDKLEGLFEERVSRALKKLGVPTAPRYWLAQRHSATASSGVVGEPGRQRAMATEPARSARRSSSGCAGSSRRAG